MLTSSPGRQHAFERSHAQREVERKLLAAAMSHGSKYYSMMQRVYPLMHRSDSSLSLSSLSLSQDSNASSLSSSNSSLDPNLIQSLRGSLSSLGIGRDGLAGNGALMSLHKKEEPKAEAAAKEEDLELKEPGSLHRCGWITKNSDEAYISFHDELWGVPVYKDDQLFELLALAGMLIDQNWTEILKRREQYRGAFKDFDHNTVAKMDEDDIIEISSNKELKLAEYRVRAIVENAKCMRKVAKEYGSFSAYIWSHVNHRPVVSRHKHLKSVPFKSPKSEAISKDLIRRGFRLVGPVIVYSFMQAAGIVIDHNVDCYRFSECVRLAEETIWGVTD